MTNFVTGIIGVSGVSTFLGFMLWWTKEPPLIIIVVVVIALLLYDLILSLTGGNGNGSGAKS